MGFGSQNCQEEESWGFFPSSLDSTTDSMYQEGTTVTCFCQSCLQIPPSLRKTLTEYMFKLMS